MMNEVDTLHGPMEFQKVVDMFTKGKDAKSVVPDAPYFRPGTELPEIKVNYVFQGAGMGDYICYLPAVIWNLQNCPWLRSKLFVAPVFMPFAANILRAYPRVEVCSLEHINSMLEPGSSLRGPGITMNGVKYNQLCNGTGGHLVELGFQYFSNVFPPPPGADIYPEITFDAGEHHLPAGLFPKTYVVITPGAVSINRTVPGQYWNPIIDHVKVRGLTSVFLGKTNFVPALKTNFPDGCNYAGGVDLRDKTTLLEAAWIMKNAACTIGLDNGLIHLASCTDAAIIAAYNMVHPKERRPNRRAGKWAELTLTREELACTNCQTNMKSMFPHTFNRCLYGDSKCIDLLFAKGAEKWTREIDRMIGAIE